MKKQGHTSTSPRETVSGLTKDEEEVAQTLSALAETCVVNAEGSPESKNSPAPAVEVGDTKLDTVLPRKKGSELWPGLSVIFSPEGTKQGGFPGVDTYLNIRSGYIELVSGRSRHNSSASLDSPSVSQQGQLLPSYGNPFCSSQANATALTKQPTQQKQLHMQQQQLHFQQHQHQQQQLNLQQQHQQRRLWEAQYRTTGQGEFRQPQLKALLSPSSKNESV